MEKSKKENKPVKAEQADLKAKSELDYWNKRKEAEGDLSRYNTHYVKYYTSHFSLDMDYYKNKKILDIGCGPRGSLEWADMADERIGLDPLAYSYLKLGAFKHKMKYISSGSEKMPFSDDYFDVVCSFNSLDHVDDLKKSIAEIIRVLKPGGLFLLISDVNHEPTACEPISYSFDIVNKFKPSFTLLEERQYEKQANGTYQSIDQNIKYDHKNANKRYGILSAKFQKI